ncbi:extracellular nuclease [unidentified eubacterium SCB49]|nr:extracellular nuclease [unidentified eubacterium SCB49]
MKKLNFLIILFICTFSQVLVAQTTIGFEDFDGNEMNLNGTLNVADYNNGGGTGGDVFGVVNGQPNGVGMPFDVADDSVFNVSGAGTGASFPADQLGIAGQNTTGFFALNDMDGINVNNAAWTFSGWGLAQIHNISIAIAAMGDFETSTSDGFIIEASIDDGVFQEIFKATTNESASKTYRPLDGGFVFTDDDPLELFIDGNATAIGFLDKSEVATGNFDTYTSEVLNGEMASEVTIRIRWEGTPSGSEPMGIDNITINGVVSNGTPQLVISEIMYNPASAEDNWEWIEVYNAGTSTIDLTGFVIDDNNGSAHSDANITEGTIEAGASAILYNVADVSSTEFLEAWGDVALIPVANWSAMSLNNGGDTIGIWENFADYTGDHQTQLNVIEQVTYDTAGDWPSNDGAGSIFLNDLTTDNTIGSNWLLSTDGASTPLFDSYTSNALGGNSGSDVGSPGLSTSAIKPLLISEVAVTPTAGEFIEIYNPNTSALDLSNVYLTDATFAGGDAYYYNIVTGTNAGGGGFGDFLARFPDGASIAPGAYQTISLTGSDSYFATYGSNPDYELFEDNTASDAIADMREALPGSIAGQGGLTNGAEVAILFYWDGATDLVTDLDYVIWGDTDEAVDKTGIIIDGPDADTTGSAYNNDTAIAAQQLMSTAAHANGESFQRQDLSEGMETTSGGNGANGHDETSEDLINTWCASVTTPGLENACGITPTALYKISEVQGDGPTTPLANQTVKVSAIVTANYQEDGQLGGFFIQEEAADMDADSNTSEAIFVYCGTCPDAVAIGDLVEVTGTAVEFFGMTQIDVTASDSLVSIINNGNALPAETVITLPVSTSTETESTFENVEGMIVNIATNLVVSEYFELARYGTLMLSAEDRVHQFSHDNTPDAAAYATYLDNLNKNRIILDDDNNRQNDATEGTTDKAYFWPREGLSNTNYIRGGDKISNLKGIMHWSFSGQSGTDAWRIRPVLDVFDYSFTNENPREITPPEVGGTFKVASFNVLNYFTTIDSRGADSAAELTRQREKIAAAICAMNADVVGLIEIENNGTVAINDLLNGTGGINDTCTATYAAVDTGAFGDDEIAMAFIYNTATVTVEGAHAILDSSVDPRFLDTKNRPALAQTFKEIATNAKITVIVNHFKSKGSACDDVNDPDLNDGAGNCNITRTEAAAALVDWLATDPTNSEDPDFLIIGDLNSYKKETPITAIIAGADDTVGTSDDYTDLLENFSGDDAYSYVFDGQLGYLDYSLASNNLLSQITGTISWNINADEISVLDYNDGIQDAGESSFERESNALPIYESNMFRASDHDPILVGMNLVSANNAPVIVCPVDITVNVDANMCTAVVTFPDATATDVDGDLNIIAQTDGLISGSDFPVGISTIEFTATDLNNNEVSCLFTITVVDNEAPNIMCPTDFTVDPGEGNLYEIPNFFETGEATANDNCTNPVTIFTQNPAVGEMLGDGVYEITLTAEDQYGNIADCNFNVTVDTTLGIQDNSLESIINIYPNPASQEVTIEKSKAILLDKMTIYDATGRVISTLDLKNMSQEKSIDISHLDSGLYLIEINSEKATITKQLIKQ